MCGRRCTPGALRELVAQLADPGVGVVSGDLRVKGDAYWTYEGFVRKRESRSGSMVQVTGSLYAVRTRDLPEIPPDTILDDVYVPLKVALSGRRIVMAESAGSLDVATLSASNEFVRKVRTLAGLVQICHRVDGCLNPAKNPLWSRFVLHKLSRLACPYALLLRPGGPGDGRGPRLRHRAHDGRRGRARRPDAVARAVATRGVADQVVPGAEPRGAVGDAVLLPWAHVGDVATGGGGPHMTPPLRVHIITEEDPFYIPVFFREFLAALPRERFELLGIDITPPLNQPTRRALARKLYHFYGGVDFVRLLGRYAVTPALDLVAPRRVWSGTIERLAARYRVACQVVANVNAPGYVEHVRRLGPDLLVSVAASQIFKPDLLSVPGLAAVNVHTGPLPRYRGMMPVFWQMYDRQRSIVVTLHTMTTGLDVGSILLQREVELNGDAASTA